jgi:hypothetical protein
MLIIVSNEIEPWFKYIWEQFVQINSLLTSYKLVTYSDPIFFNNGKKNPFLIEYNIRQTYPESLFIPKEKEFKTDDYVWIQKDLPISRGTILDNNPRDQYDIFYNAFVHLSRLEEWESEKRGKLIHSYSYNHPRKEKRIWKFPVVNYLFNELEKKIRKKFPTISFGEQVKPVIEFSHDVDYIHKTNQLRIKQTLFHFFNSAKFLLRLELKKSLLKAKSAITFAQTNCGYWCFDEWTELENDLNVKSVYYIFARSDEKRVNLKRWLLDPSYDIANDKRLIEKCKELNSHGNRLGIHGSYFSAEEERLLYKEKEILENSINIRITKSRQHWLKYYESKTPYIHSKIGIEEDSTLGFNDIPGFRSGIASIYYPYDHQNNKSFSFKVIPLVVMDSHLYDYSAGSNLLSLGWLVDSIKKVKNFTISIDWHLRVISGDYQWDSGYKNFISMVGINN